MPKRIYVKVIKNGNLIKDVCDILLTKWRGVEGFARNGSTSVEYIIDKQLAGALRYCAMIEIIARFINIQIYSLFDLV